MKQRVAIVALILFGFTAGASAQDTASAKDIRILMEKSGSGKLGVQVMNSMIPAFKQAYPKAPDEFWDNFMKQVSPDDLINLVIPIYQKYFTRTDIQQMIAFYDSPVGKKLTAALPGISAESMQVGQQWGAQLGEKVQRELQNKGYL